MPRVPGVNHKRAIRALERAGFVILREGRHTVMVRDDCIIMVPRHNPVNAITMGGIIRDAGLTADEFRSLL
jgi:predicted RNA binding protein YcfA (HicA-like mRNA interferase family)